MTLYVQLEKLLGISTDIPLSQQPIQAIHYFSLGWSPDGSRIAIVFTAFNSAESQTPDTERDTGLIVLDAEHGTARVIYGDSGYFALPGTDGGGFPIWNIAAGASVPAYVPDPGLAYAWNKQGMPYPIVKTHGPISQLPITAALSRWQPWQQFDLHDLAAGRRAWLGGRHQRGDLHDRLPLMVTRREVRYPDIRRRATATGPCPHTAKHACSRRRRHRLSHALGDAVRARP
jgi:hypothetical protein